VLVLVSHGGSLGVLLPLLVVCAVDVVVSQGGSLVLLVVVSQGGSLLELEWLLWDVLWLWEMVTVVEVQSSVSEEEDEEDEDEVGVLLVLVLVLGGGVEVVDPHPVGSTTV